MEGLTEAQQKLVLAMNLGEQGVFGTVPGVVIAGPATTAQEGWSKAPFTGMKAHYFRQRPSAAIGAAGRVREWLSLCGVATQTTDRWPMFERGNWARCSRCVQIKQRQRRSV
ncbi:hypothetical protein [Pseudomonas iridis]|uniref:hypothetical protein n=1 Tax=Pseudomonas iridis TaxID=2710587 RepID=UPI001B328804|nr:hypothetical protein [Pseudomonas iridis]MBP5971053.1 hypothetical protein [Pseudomonas iridis]